MNSNYVKKCTELLQNIPAHRPAATNIAAAGVVVAHTEPSASVPPQQPQSKTDPNDNQASKKPSRRGRTTGGGFGGRQRPIWRHPGAAPVAGRGTRSPTHKFVRSCCSSRHPDTSHPARGRVDCRWEGQAGQHAPTHVPLTPTVGDTIADPIQEGRGDADNVNHSDEIGQTNVRTVEIPSTDEGGTGKGCNRPPEECQNSQPLSWSGILSKASPLPAVSERKEETSEQKPCEQIVLTESDPLPISTSPMRASLPMKSPHSGPLPSCGTIAIHYRANSLPNLGSVVPYDLRKTTPPPDETSEKISSSIEGNGKKHDGKPIFDDNLLATLTTCPVRASGLSPGAQATYDRTDQTDGTNCVQDSPECPNCQLLQRNWQDERHRHAQESAQLTEQINYLQCTSPPPHRQTNGRHYTSKKTKRPGDNDSTHMALVRALVDIDHIGRAGLLDKQDTCRKADGHAITLSNKKDQQPDLDDIQTSKTFHHVALHLYTHTRAREALSRKQLRVDALLEQRMGETIKARYHSMEQDITKLKLAVDEKNVELVLINDLKRNLKETQNKLKRMDQERSELEKRLLEAQLENKKLELFLDTQTFHLQKVKSELSNIHTLSVRQIEYLDEPSEALSLGDSTNARRHRHPSLHNYARAVQSSECDTTTSTNGIHASPIQSLLSLGTLSQDHPTVRRTGRSQSSSKSSRIALEAATKRKSHSHSVASTTFTMEESIPSLASDSDRDNAHGGRRNTSTSWCNDNGKHNECADHRQAPGINRADHDDNRIRHQATTASASDYNAGRRKLTAAKLTDDAVDDIVKWQRDDKEHHLASRSTVRSSCATDDGDKYGQREEWSRQHTVRHDDHHQFVAELDVSVHGPPLLAATLSWHIALPPDPG
uniref:Uncharacterized protein n=1 Tax=Anopheles culicifacies TaxID=139723 RepID=A0A182MA96_9DIPT